MIYFILNPKSGNKNFRALSGMKETLSSVPDSALLITTCKGEATEMSRQMVEKKPERIIAIGGDGTINEVASAMLYTDIPLGIIPNGSGNGLAGHLQLPTSFDAALKTALGDTIRTMDAAYFNDRPFFCTAGIGFDAAVAHHFAGSRHRGFLNYIRSTILTLFRFSNIEITIRDSTTTQQKKLFSCTWANANQYGNNAIISPFSKIDDGVIEWIMIKPLHLLQIGILPIQLFSGKLHNNRYVNMSSMEEVAIEYKTDQPYHLDGEVYHTDTPDIVIRVAKAALKVIY